MVHAYGGLVFADVISLGLARKAVAAGADGLACVCAGAGGHLYAHVHGAAGAAIAGPCDDARTADGEIGTAAGAVELEGAAG